MVAQLIWIIVVYASAVVFVHLMHIREKTQRQSPPTYKWIHYILITRNHESVLEWYIREFMLHSFLTGKRLRVTCMDDGSSDNTRLLVSKMKQSGSSVEVEDFGCFENRNRYNDWKEEEIVIDMRLPELLSPLPFLQGLGSRGYRSKHGE